MRLLLDANLSGRRIARPLRQDGHDVLALSERSDLEGLADADVLALAASDERILAQQSRLRAAAQRMGRGRADARRLRPDLDVSSR